MDGGDETRLVAANIEDRQLAYLIRRWKHFTQFGEILKRLFFDPFIPLLQCRLCIGMRGGEFVQAFARDDVHYLLTTSPVFSAAFGTVSIFSVCCLKNAIMPAVVNMKTERGS